MMNCTISIAWRSCALFAAALFSAALPAAEDRKAGEVLLEPATLTTADDKEIKYELGTLYVPENRSDPNSRIIGVGFARIKSAKPTGAPPTFHLPGGPGNTILDRLYSLRGSQQLLQYLAVGDVVLVEQRGYTTRGEQLVFQYHGKPQPLDQPSSPAAMNALAMDMASAAVAEYSAKGIDLSGYTVLECADDVDDLRRALGYENINLVGQSFGSQWSFAILRRHPQIVERALLSGVEPLNNGYDMPSHVFAALQRMAWDVDRDPEMRSHLPENGSGLMGAVREIMSRLRVAPLRVQVEDPQTGRADTVVLGAEDFQLLLNFSPKPEAILAVYHGRYDAWARGIRDLRLQGTVGPDEGVKLIGWLIDSSLGVTPEREHQLRTDPAIEFLGAWNFDSYIASADIWPSRDVGDDFRTPVLNRTPVLFIQGDWDTSTPIENALGILPYFPNGHVLVVHRGPHGARGEIERDMPDVMQKVLEFLRTGRTEQLPVKVELPRSDAQTRVPPPPSADGSGADPRGAESSQRRWHRFSVSSNANGDQSNEAQMGRAKGVVGRRLVGGDGLLVSWVAGGCGSRCHAGAHDGCEDRERSRGPDEPLGGQRRLLGHRAARQG
jgi:pimeloyl-ACP methyl ester carboxylesterase